MLSADHDSIEETGDPAALTRPRRSRVVWVTLVSAGLLFALVIAWLVLDHLAVPGAEPPLPDLSGAAPVVVEAIHLSRDRVLAKPRDAEAWGELAMLLRAHDYAEQANRCYERAAQLAPGDARWQYLWGISLATLDPEEALSHFRQAVQIRPDFGYAHLRLAELLLSRDELDEAERHLQGVIQREPNNARAQLGLAQLAWQRGDVSESLQWARRSAAAAPGKRATHELLARIYHRLGDGQAADEQLALLRNIAPGMTYWDDPLAARVLELRRDPEWTVMRAQRMFAEGHVRQAVTLLEDVVRRSPDVSEFHAELGRMLIYVGDLDLAAEVLDQAIQRFPESSELQRLRGVIHISLGEWPAAVQRLQQAIQLKPDDAAAYDNLGYCLLQQGDRQGALGAYRSAVRFQPDFAEAHVQIGRLLLEDGQREQAARHLRLAVQFAPDDPQAAKLLEDAQSGN